MLSLLFKVSAILTGEMVMLLYGSSLFMLTHFIQMVQLYIRRILM